MIVVEDAGGTGEEERRQYTPAFWDVIRAHMDAKGIEDVEKLHRQFVKTDYGYTPIRGRQRNKPVPLKEFKRYVAGKYPVFYGEVIRELMEVLDELVSPTCLAAGVRRSAHKAAVGKPRGSGYPCYCGSPGPLRRAVPSA